jgi:hypothetical protein
MRSIRIKDNRMNKHNFEEFWMKYKTKPLSDRKKYVDSLSKKDRNQLFNSFFSDGWYELFLRNEMNEVLDYVKEKYEIDLIDLRIKALKFNKVSLIDKIIWQHIQELFAEFDPLFDTHIIFGGLAIAPWGTHKQFYLISPASRCRN